MDHFERESRRLIDGLVRELVLVARDVVKAAFAEARSDVRLDRRARKVRAKEAKRKRRETARQARLEARIAKRDARVAERSERERLRVERRAERDRLRAELRSVREQRRAVERQQREERRSTTRRAQQGGLLGSDVQIRPNQLFVHKRKTDGSIQPLVRGDRPSAPPPAI
jgi:hypothetical protein